MLFWIVYYFKRVFTAILTVVSFFTCGRIFFQCVYLRVELLGYRSEKAMATHSSTLARKIPWMEEPGGLQSMGSRRVGHDWAASLSLFTLMPWRRKWQPTPVFLPGESQGQWAPVYGVAQSRTQLKWLSSSSSQIAQKAWWSGSDSWLWPNKPSHSPPHPQSLPSRPRGC